MASFTIMDGFQSGVKVFTFCTHTASETLTKLLVLSRFNFDDTPNCHVFEEFREHLNLPVDKTALQRLES
jgi:hypothetical protein